MCCIAMRGLPSLWCELFGFRKMASFSIALYSEAMATNLAREYFRVMDYYNRV